MLPKSLSSFRRVWRYRYLMVFGLLGSAALLCQQATPWPTRAAKALTGTTTPDSGMVSGNTASLAATFTVTNTNDSGAGTLRQAIADANANAGADTIAFAAGVTGTISLLTALPNLADDVTISGPGANVLTVQRATGTCSDNGAECTSTNKGLCGNPATAVCNPNAGFRIFTVNSGKTVTISGLTITNGTGGIQNDQANLTLSDCIISGNTTSGSGGGVSNSNGVLAVTNCTITGNSAHFGGGINSTADATRTAAVTIQKSTLSGNSASAPGGALYNAANFGGNASAVIRNSTLDGNSGSVGGGVYNLNASAIIQNTTLSGNSSLVGVGGGISNNSSSAVTIGSTILKAGAGSNIANSSSTVTSLGFNLSSDDQSAFLNQSTDQNSTDPMLGALAYYGGPTATHALKVGSPAQDSGKNFSGATTDQRGPGFPRTLNGPTVAGGDGTDIGAVERQPTQFDPTLIVTTTADTNTNNTCDPANPCSLRDAITAANASAPDDVIYFAVTGTITLNTNGALPNLNSNMMILGPGANALTVKRDPSAAAFRIFTLNSGMTVTILGLTISGGSSGLGGGIYNFHANLTLNNCTVSGNSAGVVGGGIENDGFQFPPVPTLTVNNSTISGNSAGVTGGGINNEAGAGSATLTINNSTISGNSADRGGGIENFYGGGGGNVTLIIKNSTISGNSAVRSGGGIENLGTAATVDLTNTILNAGTSGENLSNQQAGIVTSHGYNLSSDGTGPNNGTTDQINTNPMLGPLQDNGGPTFTHALLPGSPAIDKGKNLGGSITDQRGPGFARTFDKLIANAPGGDGTDIGALEVQNEAPAITGATISRVQGGPSSNSQIATVSDDADPPTALTVTVNSSNPSNGVTVSGISVDGLGNVTATVAASCSASNATFILRVTDTGGLFAEATLTVNVTANTAPILTYNAASVPYGGSTTINPATATDNGSITGYSVQSVVPALMTAPTVNSGGVVSITNAQPAGMHTVTIRATDNCGMVTDASFTLTVNKGDQTITFGVLANKTFGDPDFSVSATASSGLPVSFAASGNCTVTSPSPGTVHLTGAGSCTITASQGGDANFNPAPNVPQSFNISKANQTITFGALANKTFGDPDFNVSATATSGLPVSFAASGNCTVTSPSPGTVHLTGAGSCTITASQSGDANYNPASNVPQSFTINKANQTITFGALGTKTFGDPDFGVSATASSGLAVSLAASGNCTVSSPSPGTVHITGAGSCTITASQAGDANYNPATNVPQSFTINKANQTITFGALANKTFGDPDFAVSATASSGLAVSFAASGNCTVTSPSPGTVHITGAGPCTITASQAGDANYNPATNVPQSFTISKANQTINFGALANKSFGDPDFAVNATASSGLPVSFAASGNCTVSSPSPGTVHITGAGACTITASQAGDSNYNPATNVPQTFTIAKAATNTAVSSNFNPSDLNQSVTFRADVSSVAPKTGTVQFKDNGNNLGAPVAIDNLGTALLTTSSLTTGTHTITAEYSGDASFLPSTGTLQGGQVVKAQPGLSINDVSITEGNAGTKVLTFTITLSAGSNLPVSVDYATANVSATAGSDYVATNGSFTFNPLDNDVTRTVNVTINGDVSFEPDETFTVTLTNPVNAIISKAVGTGTIQNDDVQGGFISFSQANYSVNESAGLVTLTVTRTNDVSQAANVDYATDDTGASTNCAALNTGLASQRCDYTSVFGTLKFAANETQKTIDVPINLDAYTEGPETFTVKLSNPTGGAVLTVPSTATVTINDSVSPTPNAIDDTTTFVRQQYHDFLNREADPAGLAFWKNNIDKCNDPAQRPPGQTLAQCIEIQRITTSAAFFLSIEFKQTGGTVREFYVAALDRPATNNMPNFVEFMRDTQAIQRGVVVGQGNWQQVLDANRTAFMNEFVTRPEFVALYPTTDTPAQYVDKLYQHANVAPVTIQERLDAILEFGGAPTATDPVARGRVLLRITLNGNFQAREANRTFVQIEYFGYLRRNPNDPPDNNFNGYNFWVAKLNQFNSDFLQAEMVKAFLSSLEYRGRFGP